MIAAGELRTDILRLPGYDPQATAAGAWFDDAAAQRAIDFFAQCLTHIEGELAGRPFLLEPWQRGIIANLFGWRRKDRFGRERRRYREALIFVPRKNGKTPLVAGIGLYYLFCDPLRGQQNYIGAATREQAGLMFRYCKGMVFNEPHLQRRCSIHGGRAPGGQSQSIVMDAKASFLKIVSGEDTAGHGKTMDFGALDEVHEHRTRALYEQFRTSMASANKPDGLLVMATTADFARESVCNEVYDYACKVRDGIVDDPAFLPVIYEAAKDDDWQSPEVWARANPNLGVSVSMEYMERESRRAKDEPSYENEFKRLHLNIRTEQSVRLIPMNQWDACGAPFDPAILEGRPCIGGLDLATVKDLAAFSLVFPPEETGGEYYILCWAWCPREEMLARVRARRVPYDHWEREGILMPTETYSTDYEAIRAFINGLRDRYQIQEICFDPWNAKHLCCTELQDQDGFTMVEVRQGYTSLNEPTKFLLRLLADGRLRHGGNPMLRWMAANTAAKTDPAGNLKPDKAASAEKIDGIVATITALARAMLFDGGSVYESRGLYGAELEDARDESNATLA